MSLKQLEDEKKRKKTFDHFFQRENLSIVSDSRPTPLLITVSKDFKVSTMRFATRMMCVATEPAINEVFDPAVLVKKLQKEIMHLKNELAMHDTLTNRSQVVYDPLSEQQKYEIKQQVRRYLEGSLDEIDIINIRQIQGVFESFREIYQQMEKDVEERLRHKFALIDRTDPAAIAAAQQAGIPITDEGILVGESDSTGFGVGVAPSSDGAAC